MKYLKEMGMYGNLQGVLEGLSSKRHPVEIMDYLNSLDKFSALNVYRAFFPAVLILMHALHQKDGLSRMQMDLEYGISQVLTVEELAIDGTDMVSLHPCIALFQNVKDLMLNTVPLKSFPIWALKLPKLNFLTLSDDCSYLITDDIRSMINDSGVNVYIGNIAV